MTLDRVDSERLVVGALLQKADLFLTAAAEIDAGDFTLEANRAVYCAISDEVAAGHPIDIPSIAAVLAKRRQLEMVGGSSYLAELTDLNPPVASSVKHHAKAIREVSMLRSIVKIGESAAAMAQEQQESSSALIARVNNDLMALIQRNQGLTVRSVKDIMFSVREELEEQAKNDGLLGIPTGIAGLDETTTGIRLGEMWVVGAMPSRGKTALGVQMGAASVIAGFPTLVFSLEMTGNEVGRRLLANFSGVSAARIRDPKYIARDEWPKVIDAAAKIGEWPLWIDDASSLTAAQLATRARLYIRTHGIKLIVVDYLMLVQEPTEKERRNKAGKIAETMRRVAKEEKVAVVLLSQVRRIEGGVNGVPTMTDLKESGDIEAHAHTVVLIYMPVNDEKKFTGNEELHIGKQRHGGLGIVPVHYNTHTLRFEDR